MKAKNITRTFSYMNVMYKLKLLYFDRIDFFQGIDVNKTSASMEYDICHCCYSLEKEFTWQPNVWNCSHDVLMMSMILSNIAILNINGVDYRCVINVISKSKAAILLQIANLNGKSGTL